GYGMLLAVHMGDKYTFDELWAYAKRYRNSNGMIAWLVDRYGTPVDSGAATDGDQDMAYALLVADTRWGGYWTDLAALVGAIKQHAVEPRSEGRGASRWTASS
ncbi:MAG: glycosyl hydrolase family 8, partial [Gemmatimonadota bacterium]|nr:glycosyl hydrolase family 8 [Gemmatimonadota bacterium]